MEMPEYFETDALLESAPASVTSVEAQDLLRRHFRMTGTVRQLSSERDANFRVDGRDGTYLLKITNPAEDAAVTDLQTLALRHLERRAPSLPVPRIIQTVDGTNQAFERFAGRTHVVRLISFLPGVPLHAYPDSSAMRAAVGRTLGGLDLGLRDFRHAAADHDLLWNACKASRIRPLIPSIRDLDRRSLAQRALDEYEVYAVPKLPNLRRQVIHNDFNPHNVLVESEAEPNLISGIIDFGDIIRAPLVNDVATAIAYQDFGAAAPGQVVAEVIAAYDEVCPLVAEELDVVLDLVRARQVMVGAITAWRAARQPEYQSYILKNTERVWRGLEALGSVQRPEFRQTLVEACERRSK